MKFLFTLDTILMLSCFTVLFMFMLSITAQVYSQMPPGNTGENLQMPPGSEMSSLGMKIVQGNYSNAEFGIELNLPEGSGAYEAQNRGVTELSMPTPPLGAELKLSLSVSPEGSSEIKSVMDPLAAGAEPAGCLLGSKTVTLGGKNARVSDEPCNITNPIAPGTKFNIRSYYIDFGNDKSLWIYLFAPKSMYDQSIPGVEEVVNTIKFTK